MAETLVVTSKVKKIVKDQGFRTSGDYIEALSKKVNEILQASIENVKNDGKRKTLSLQDL